MTAGYYIGQYSTFTKDLGGSQICLDGKNFGFGCGDA